MSLTAQGVCTGGGHKYCSVSGRGKHVGQFTVEAGVGFFTPQVDSFRLIGIHSRS